MKEDFKQKVDELKKLFEILDIKKLEDDIVEGENLLGSKNISAIKKYLERIIREYKEYIDLKNYFNTSNKTTPIETQPINIILNGYINFLKDLREIKIGEKLLKEIFKIMEE